MHKLTKTIFTDTPKLLGKGVFGDTAGVPKSQLAIIPGTNHVSVMMETENTCSNKFFLKMLTTKKMKRLILSILAGLFTSAILASAVDHAFHSSGIYPPYGEPNLDNGLMLIAFIYRVIFGILGGYITAVLAKEKARKAVLILGTIGSVLWLVGAIALWNHAPIWYNLIGVITGVPIALIGLRIYQTRQKILLEQ